MKLEPNDAPIMHGYYLDVDTQNNANNDKNSHGSSSRMEGLARISSGDDLFERGSDDHTFNTAAAGQNQQQALRK